jgi:hypothetical protein
MKLSTRQVKLDYLIRLLGICIERNDKESADIMEFEIKILANQIGDSNKSEILQQQILKEWDAA